VTPLAGEWLRLDKQRWACGDCRDKCTRRLWPLARPAGLGAWSGSAGTGGCFAYQRQPDAEPADHARFPLARKPEAGVAILVGHVEH
jgi:hypothetical protein